MPSPVNHPRPRSRLRWLLLTCALLAVHGNGKAEEAPLPAPPGMVKHPPGNPATADKVALGRDLFFDTRLSRDGKVSCATCHDPDKGFSNGERVAVGVDGQRGKRNVPSLINVGHGKSLFWDGRTATLEEQALLPIDNPEEMDMRPRVLAEKLNGVPSYREKMQTVFGGKVTPERIALALAAYERTLVSRDTPFDRFLRGDKAALSERALRGMQLFFGQARCVLCHKGPSLSDDLFHNVGTADGPEDLGRRAVTRDEKDQGSFRTPQLREVGKTAPYMHNGRFKTLAEVVRHYNFGGVTDQENDYRDPNLEVLYLGEDQVNDLVAFLAEGLTSRPPHKKQH